MTRAEHLQWAKDRAIAYVNAGDTKTAWVSFVSDLGKHDELCNHAAIELGTSMYVNGLLASPAEMTRFIEGFN